MKQKIFVFRISKGHEGGKPIGNCPLDYRDIKLQINNLTDDDIKLIDYCNNNYLEFIHDELWENNILRQGWGIRGLDLRRNQKRWIEKYMYNGKIYWDAEIECKDANGRRNILRRMLDIDINDFILLPKTSKNHLDNYHEFSICQLEKKYYFDCRIGIDDFGHCLKVKNLKSFAYNKDTLLQGDFGSPYLWAITEVQEWHSRYSRFVDFLEKNYIMQ